MLLLAIDTAGPDCAVAITRGEAEGAEFLARRAERIGRGHAELLMPMIAAALAEAGAAYTDLGQIAVAAGPGSFTGIRVGIAAARGLSLALAIPALGIGSLQALAFQAGRTERDGTIVAALDAKRGEIHAFAQDQASGAVALPPIVADAAAIAKRLDALPQPLVLIGSGAPALTTLLDPNSIRLAGVAECPDIESIAVLGLRGEGAMPPVPVYLRGADAKPQAGKAVARA